MAESNESLKARWDTPRGRQLRARVMKDLRFARGEHLGEILREFGGADEVQGGLDLRCVKFDGENLDGVDLSSCDLTGADLAKTSLRRAVLRATRLDSARLVGADLREADLSEAELAGANLARARLDGAVLVAANLTRTRCGETAFRNAALASATLREAVIARADFEGADMTSADVRGAYATPATFAKASAPPDGQDELAEGGAPDDSTVSRSPTIDVQKLFVAKKQTRAAKPGVPRAPKNGGAAPEPVRSWDVALAALLQMRGRVSKLTVVIDGVERVFFEQPGASAPPPSSDASD